MASTKSVDGVRYITPEVREEISLDRRYGYVYHRLKAMVPGYHSTKWERRIIHAANGYEYFIVNGAREYIHTYAPGEMTWNEWAEGIRRGKW